ncbi:TonB-dependent siderophore receptor [Pseudothauera nasutitermitis]|uniref:TonB-dependent siderophore receptor n=1 Tax=Pseudothauera nasutitermitis TaxID=2565930 RepID=A0A4S4AZH8_9RHOO|nr:TonB-dependent siderophore receptor [Pseudothauera nasutitermitis]THF65590.1 TonB-dependent siderophore receptor [Pseudothauera nasutitermitis]
MRTGRRRPLHPLPAPRHTRLAAALCHALLCTTLGAVSLPLAAQQNAPADASATFDIAAGPLDTALDTLARQAGISILYDSQALHGHSAPALSGAHPIEAALTRLLAGSGFMAVQTERGDYRLVPAPASPATQLPEVAVTAAAERAGVTEGTGRYTTGSTRSATGLNLSLRETPQSVSVVTRQQIEDQGYITAKEALDNVTGVHGLAWDTKRTYYWVRGFSVDRVSYDGVVSNDVSGGSYGDNAQDLAFYDRVEVVRGATGLLTGAGEPSATINYVRKRANSKTFQGEASVDAGSWDNLRGSVDLSTPLTGDGRVRARVVAVAQEKESFRDYYEGSKRALYGTVEADITSQTRLSLGVEYQRDKPTGATWGGLPLLYSDGTRTNWSRSMNAGTRWTRWDSTTQSVFADLEHHFNNGWSLKGNLNYREMDYQTKLFYQYGNLDRDTGIVPSAPYPWKGDATYRQSTGSLQASGPFSLLGREHELMVGFNSTRRRAQDESWNAINAAAIGDYHQWDGSYPEPDWGNYTRSDVTRTRENALYVATRLSVADPLKVILGGRHTSWRSTVATTRRAHKEFAPYVGVVYDLGQAHSLYASYTEIFSPQNYRDVHGRYLDPATGSNYEIGLKGEYLEGRLNASVALFRTLKDDVATQDGTNLVPGTTSYAYVGADGVKSRGIEAEISGELLPGWNLTAGIARTLTKNPDGSAFNPYLPRTLFNAGTSWRLPGAWNRLTVGGNVRWQNATYTNLTVTSGTYRYEQPSFAVVGLMARYEFAPQLSLQVNVNNLFDKKYWAHYSGQGTYGDPRNFYATLKYKF